MRGLALLVVAIAGCAASEPVAVRPERPRAQRGRVEGPSSDSAGPRSGRTDSRSGRTDDQPIAIVLTGSRDRPPPAPPEPPKPKPRNLRAEQLERALAEKERAKEAAAAPKAKTPAPAGPRWRPDRDEEVQGLAGAEIRIVNNTPYDLTFSAGAARATLSPGETSTLSLAPGSYSVFASVDVPNVTPYEGSLAAQAGRRYHTAFVIIRRPRF